MDSLDYYKIISEFKEDKRKYLFEDEPLDGVFKKEKTGSNSIVKVKYFLNKILLFRYSNLRD
jgi:hypothetical protein